MPLCGSPARDRLLRFGGLLAEERRNNLRNRPETRTAAATTTVSLEQSSCHSVGVLREIACCALVDCFAEGGRCTAAAAAAAGS